MAIANPISFSSSSLSLRSLHRPLPRFSSPQTLTLTLTLVPLSSSTSARSSSSRGWRRRRWERRGETLAAASSSSSSSSPAEELSAAEEEWLRKLPEKKKPLYSHSLPCIEAWLRRLGFRRSRDDRAVWLAENPLWHAQLSLDVTDLYIRYLKSGPGNLEKDVERRFSYALSREDIENAILGGP